jgi:hypothetical protein
VRVGLPKSSFCMVSIVVQQQHQQHQGPHHHHPQQHPSHPHHLPLRRTTKKNRSVGVTASIMLYLSFRSTTLTASSPIVRRPLKTTTTPSSSAVVSSLLHSRRRSLAFISASSVGFEPIARIRHYSHGESQPSWRRTTVVSQRYPGGTSPLPLLNHPGRFGGGGRDRGSRLSLQPFSSVNILTTERVTAVLEGSPTSLGLRLQSQSSSSSSSSSSQPDTPSSSTIILERDTARKFHGHVGKYLLPQSPRTSHGTLDARIRVQG